MRHALVAGALLLLAVGCGDDSGGAVNRAPEDALDAVHRSWETGAQIGFAILSTQRKDPATLDAIRRYVAGMKQR